MAYVITSVLCVKAFDHIGQSEFHPSGTANKQDSQSHVKTPVGTKGKRHHLITEVVFVHLI